MVVEYSRYQVAIDQRKAFVAAPECLGYELTECEEEAGQFILRIEWKSTEEHLQGFRKGPQFAEFFAYVKGFYNNIQEMRHYRLTEVVHAKSAT